ncbi:hypothetical protein [Microbacterium sp. NPDC076911]|uniref:hypothetical protein n=1 Tax=Microbacterium sp. NPDC076911 TaxID=3154958 RepID=UPI00342E5ED6
MTDMPTSSSTPRTALSVPYRSIRPVRAADDAPFEGMLTTVASGDTCVLVDAQSLPARWDGWSADPGGHLVAPLAIVRRSDGHDVALPALTERVEDFVARRRNIGAGLSKGERVTLAVSVTRGLSEVTGSGAVFGQWWLTPSGRPVLATGSSTDEARAKSLSLIHDITEDDASGPVWTEALAALSGAVDNVREYERAEELFFTIAEPSPLATSALRSTRTARDLASHTANTFDEILMPRSRGLTDRLARHVDADLADTFSRATTAVWRWLTRSRQMSSKRAPWLVAAAVTTVVLAGGLLWPSEDGDPATAELPSESTATTTSNGSDPNDSPSDIPALDSAGAETAETTDARSDADITMAVDTLLTRRASCEGDEACESAFAVNSGLLQPAGVIDQTSDQRTQTLIDEYGGVAVVRVAPRADGEPQIVVVELRNDEWLLRDVYDAEQ